MIEMFDLKTLGGCEKALIYNDLICKVLHGFSCRHENDVSKVLFKNPIFGNHRVNRVFITSCRDY